MKKETFDLLFNRFYNPLCNYASKYLGDDITAEDIVQGVFVKILERQDQTEILDPEKYLIRSVKFKCIDHLRRKSRKTEISIAPDKLPDSGEEEHDENRDHLAIITYLLDLLPNKTRQVFILSRQSGLTYREIAEELNISIKTVENQMGRALKILRIGFQKYQDQ